MHKLDCGFVMCVRMQNEMDTQCVGYIPTLKRPADAKVNWNGNTKTPTGPVHFVHIQLGGWEWKPERRQNRADAAT